MSVSSYLVPSKAESILYGYDAVEIGVRKAHLIKGGRRVKSARCNTADLAKHKDFYAWVEFIERNA